MTDAPVFDDSFRAGLHDLLVWRRDVRRFRRDALPDGTLERLIASAALAPSVGLSQPTRFVIVTDPARGRAIRENFEASNATALSEHEGERAALYARLKLAGLDEAPSHLAVFADRGTAQGHGLGRRTMPETIEYSTVAAIHTLWLVARAEEIGLGWVSILDPARIAATLDVPAEWLFVGYLCIGYPAGEDDTPALAREGWEARRPAAETILYR
jgi:5,6-dimethylbenzimidazole synthase